MRTILTIEGANNAGANYIGWAPIRSTIRLVEAGQGVNSAAVTLRNRNASQGGKVEFYNVIPGQVQDELSLLLPANGTPVQFFVAGKFGRPSLNDRDAVIEAVETNSGNVLSTTPLMVRVRKNANTMAPEERNRFLSALARLNNRGMGRFRDFRNMHTDLTSPEAHGLAGFLPWHRAYLLDLERELQAIDPSVALPYWRFDRPARNLFTRAFMGVSDSNDRVQFSAGNPLQFWVTDGAPGIVRGPEFRTDTQSAFVISEPSTLGLGGAGNLFSGFATMEGNPHGSAHVSFRGSLRSIDTAAKDPLFFFLHANVDRLWAKWQWFNRRFDSTNLASYQFQGAAGDPGSIRVGHNLHDTMWPWNQITTLPRPTTAPGGRFPSSPGAAAPGLSPVVRDMIDHQGVVTPSDRLGFDYDDVPFEF
jgi:tyrosinase